MRLQRLIPAVCACLAFALAGTPISAEEKAPGDKPPADNPPPAKPAADKPAAGDSKIFLDAWSYSRERKTVTGSNRVTARVMLKNISEANLDGVTVAISFHSGLGEKVGGPLTQSLGTVKPKESKQIQVAGEFIPVFGSYQVLVTYSGGKEEWSCNSDLGNPEPKVNGTPDTVANLILLGEEVGPDKFNRLSGQLRIKNAGKMEAKNCKVTVTYYAAAAQPAKGGKGGGATNASKIGEWSGPLGDGKFPGACERNIPLTVPQPMPKGAVHYEIKIACDDTPLEAQLSGGDFQNVKDLETGHVEFKRSGAKQENLDVTLQVRNGLETPAAGIKLTFTFFAMEKGEKKVIKTHVQEVPGEVPAGGVTPVNFSIPGMPKYDSYEQAIEYGKGAGAAAQPAIGAKEPVFKKQNTVEVLLKSFSAADDGNVAVVCAARNGRPMVVKEVEVIVHFFDASGKETATGSKTLPDPISSGEIRNFILHAEHAKGYATYKSEVKFQEEKPTAPAGDDVAKTGAAK
ncbi:MAG: hypothetical protein HY291_22685 [Planctomycetes bacterium]|nr:hypothetical protein [Planctomycetota bacterium]